MKKVILTFFTILTLSQYSIAQKDSINYEISMNGITSIGNHSTFWLQSLNFGSVLPAPNSSNLFLGFNKDFRRKNSLFNYSFKANALVQTDFKKSDVYFHELYGSAKISIFDLIIGARKEFIGNQDSSLSSGGILFSRNSRPMPKITLGIERYTAFPYTKGLLQFKGALSHGFFIDNTYATGVYLHHKYIFLKAGGKLPINLEYGIDNVAQWGGNTPDRGLQPISLKDFLRILTGSSGSQSASTPDQINALGNHIISQSLKLDIKLKHFEISGYWQNISEDSPIRFITKSINRPDGLWGVTLKNKKAKFVKKVLYEYINTTDQSGPFHDRDGIVYGGEDNYFSHFNYKSGWTYYNRVIGTPFITYLPTFKDYSTDRVLNNKVQVHHFGVEGEIDKYKYKLLGSFSKNYGIYEYVGTAYLDKIRNTSFLIDVNKSFPKLSNIEIGVALSADFGKLNGNSSACMITIKKTGHLFSY